MTRLKAVETDQLIQVLRHRHVFAELRNGALERREIEDRLGVSRATSHRYVRTLDELGLVEKRDGQFVLTDFGDDVASAVKRFETEVGQRLQLGPLFDATERVTPPIDIDAFLTATVTNSEEGDPFAPFTRFVSLVQDTNSLRGINTCRIAPTYIDEFKNRIFGGMETELIDVPEINRDIMERYPEKCVQVCVSDHLSLFVHDVRNALPFGLVLFDDRIGIGLFEQSSGTLQQFIDTTDPEAREWAESVYEEYKSDSKYLENFTVTGLEAAISEF